MTLKDKALAFCQRIKQHTQQTVEHYDVKSLLAQYPHRYVHDMRVRSRGNHIESTGVGSRCAVWSTPRVVDGDVLWSDRGVFIAYRVSPGKDADMVYASFLKVDDEELIKTLVPQNQRLLHMAGLL